MSDSDSGSDFDPEKATKKNESSDESEEEVVKPKKSDKKKDAEKAKKPKSKKRKAETDSEEEDDDNSEEEAPPKKGKKAAKKDEESELPGSIDLGSMRYVTTSEFRGKKYVQIREYYRGNDGKLAPGKKGISFTTDQLKTLIEKVPEIKEKFL